ncbi:spore germination protein GerPE [Lentibacillus sp.]|jgi:spore germination protein PE|uniref:spore germination protein GerPE n=1 Tax=Lentibacillus sp. TaxID=1925746 RepID=UPI002B4B240C|nr:spore germination protein GerPE [Lentibacillus sp.]HLS09670.1 spore germination protein GerPE [Lentibacillus sp.]
MVKKRTALTEKISLNGLTYSAVFNIGDTKMSNPQSRGIAVQKEGASFQGDDGVFFDKYELFHQKANWPKPAVSMHKNTCHHNDTIRVNRVDMTGVSQAGVFQVGSIDQVFSEARIKHMRKYLND